MANRLSWAVWKTSLAWSIFRSHLNTDHTCDSPEIKKIFQLHYGTVKEWPSQQMCKCLATGGIALLSACNTKMRLYNYTEGTDVMFLKTLLYCLIKTATMTEVTFCNTWHKGMIPYWPLQFQDDFLILFENNSEVRGYWLQVAQHLPVPDHPW